ncbi:hypothetical protein ABZN20_07655 [Methylococcus sp. ANG]|uniref:hypothetical protein n=1 Tax=Methylococcus sp. ANG TaxID=3231903 RepID=UPI00345AB042
MTKKEEHEKESTGKEVEAAEPVATRAYPRSLSDYGFTRVGILGIENFSGALAG